MNYIPSLIFYSFAVLALGSALVVVTSRNIFHSALALALTLSVIGGFFALLGADFLAASQVLVYVGGVMIIMLFVVMLSQQPMDALARQTNQQWLWGALFAAAVGSALVIHLGEVYRGVGEITTIRPT